MSGQQFIPPPPPAVGGSIWSRLGYNSKTNSSRNISCSTMTNIDMLSAAKQAHLLLLSSKSDSASSNGGDGRNQSPKISDFCFDNDKVTYLLN